MYCYIIDNNDIARVTQAKVLGVTLSSDLTWNAHVDTIVSARKRVFTIYQLKRAGIRQCDLLRVYVSVIRPVLEYATLFERRTKLCQSYFRKMHNADHKLNKLLPNQRNISYDLRTYNTLPVPLAMTDRFRRSLIPWGLANWQHNVL